MNQVMRVATAVDVHAFESSFEHGVAQSGGAQLGGVQSDSTTQSSIAAQTSGAAQLDDTAQLGAGQSGAAHPDSAARPLMLACLEWPGHRALAGHSDGDVAAHAVCDAILIAAGVGEMGTIFGVDRPEFAGASGESFIREALRLAREVGFAVTNISVQIVAQTPRFAPYKDAAQARMSAIVGAPVSVAATSTDHLGFIGAGEGIAAIATALLHGIS